MKESMRAMARPYGILFAMALVVAVLARVGLAIMDATGWLSYDYISASGVPMLDVVAPSSRARRSWRFCSRRR